MKYLTCPSLSFNKDFLFLLWSGRIIEKSISLRIILYIAIEAVLKMSTNKAHLLFNLWINV